MTDSTTHAASPGKGGVRERLFLAFLVCALTVAYGWTARRTYIRWTGENSYYTHGFLIPIVSIALLYWRRDALRKAAAERRPSRLGWLLLVPSLVLHLLATAWQVGFLSGFSLLGVLYGLVLLLFGRPMLRATFFPVLFLAFMIPLPYELIEKLSFNLKLMSAGVATRVVGFLGVVVVRSGSVLRIETGTLVVDDVCSGLKYLISLTAFAALYAHISRVKLWGKWTLFALSLPVAFVANAARVAVMVLVGRYVSIPATQSWYFHDLFGFLLFIFAFVTLFGVESLMLGEYGLRRGKNAPSDDPPPEKSDGAGTPHWSGKTRLPAFAAIAMGLAAALSVYLAWPRGTAPSEHVKDFPLEIGEWRGKDYRMDPRVYEILGTEDILSRRYRNRGGEAVTLMAIVAHQARRRTHPPEHCLTGEGFRVGARANRVVRFAVGEGTRAIEVRELLVDRDGKTSVSWYFFKSGETLHTNYWAHQIGLALRKVRDPRAADVLIRLDAPPDGKDIEAMRRLLQRFLDDAGEALLLKLP